MWLEQRRKAMLQLHLHSWLKTWLEWIAQRQLQDETRDILVSGFGAPYIKDFMVVKTSIPISHCNRVPILSFSNHRHNNENIFMHYNDVIMGTIAFQITSLTIIYSTVYSDADERKYQSSASLAFVRWIHWRPVNSPHKWPVMRKIFPFHDVIMNVQINAAV